MPTNSEYYVIQIDDVIAIHDSQVAQFGGLAGIRDRSLIEAAVGRPYTGYYPTIETKERRSLSPWRAIMASSTATNVPPWSRWTCYSSEADIASGLMT